MAKCTLDLSHPSFLASIGLSVNDAAFMEGLKHLKEKVEAEHTSCHHVVQPMPKYPDCHGKIWKYDWAPSGQRSATRKAWRMVAIVPDPTAQPLTVVAAAVYSKNATDQLTVKQLAAIFTKIANPTKQVPALNSMALGGQFSRYPKHDGSTISICRECGETAAEGLVLAEIESAEVQHSMQCSGPIQA